MGNLVVIVGLVMMQVLFWGSIIAVAIFAILRFS